MFRLFNLGLHKTISKSTSSMWATEVDYVDLEKEQKGLGFSILDYQVGDNHTGLLDSSKI